jgi:hypothetical protein
MLQGLRDLQGALSTAFDATPSFDLPTMQSILDPKPWTPLIDAAQGGTELELFCNRAEEILSRWSEQIGLMDMSDNLIQAVSPSSLRASIRPY